MKKLLLTSILACAFILPAQAGNNPSEASLLSGALTLSVVVVVSAQLPLLLSDISNSSTQASNSNDKKIKSVRVTEVVQKENNRTLIKTLVRSGDKEDNLEFEVDAKTGYTVVPGDYLNVEKLNSDFLLTKNGKSLVLVQGSEKSGNFRQKKFD